MESISVIYCNNCDLKPESKGCLLIFKEKGVRYLRVTEMEDLRRMNKDDNKNLVLWTCNDGDIRRYEDESRYFHRERRTMCTYTEDCGTNKV